MRSSSCTRALYLGGDAGEHGVLGFGEVQLRAVCNHRCGMIAFEDVRLLCTRREVDLVLYGGRPPYELCLRGQFDNYGDYFSVLARGVEYVELASGIPVGDMLMTDATDLPRVAGKWQHLRGQYSGSALVVLSADADGWDSAGPHDLFVVIANLIEVEAGTQWRAVGGR